MVSQPVSPPPSEDETYILSWRQLIIGFTNLYGGFLLRMVVFGVIMGNLFIYAQSMLYHAYTPDFPWLYRTGEYIIQHQSLPSHDIFSWTFPHQVWVLYQWLFEVLTAFIRNTIGEKNLFRLFILFAFGIYVGVPYITHRKQHVSSLISIVVTSSALSMAAINLSLRPMIATLVCLLLQYSLLEALREKRLPVKHVAPLLMLIYCLWANMHTGVTLGLASFAVMAVGDSIERLGWYRFKPPNANDISQSLGLKTYALIAILCFAASLINPYGFGIYTYISHLSGQTYLNDIIVELQSPDFHLLNYWYFAGFIGLLILLMARVTRLFRASELLHLVLFTLATLFAQRFIVWVALYFAMIIPLALTRLYQLINVSKNNFITDAVVGFERYRPLLLMLIVAGVVILYAAPKGVATLEQGSCGKLLPGIAAYEHLKRPEDRLYHDPEVGSCMLIAYPQQKVFVDTRFDFYGSKFTEEGRDASGLINNWEGFLNHWHINTILLGKNWPLTQALLLRPADYPKQYEDDEMVLLRRKPQTGVVN